MKEKILYLPFFVHSETSKNYMALEILSLCNLIWLISKTSHSTLYTKFQGVINSLKFYRTFFLQNNLIKFSCKGVKIKKKFWFSWLFPFNRVSKFQRGMNKKKREEQYEKSEEKVERMPEKIEETHKTKFLDRSKK